MRKIAKSIAGFSGVLGGQSVHGPAPTVFNLILHRRMSRLFVGGLSFRTEEEGLKNAFAKHGEVIDVKVITDRETGRSRGFGFVTYLSDSEAEAAIGKMDGQFLDGRVIRVNKASPRPAPPRFNPEPETDSTPGAVEDWGSIPPSIASVSQNAGLGDGATNVGGSSDAPTPSPSSAGTTSSIASSDTRPSSSKVDLGLSELRNTRASTKDTGESFDFIDLDLSNLPPPDPDRLPRRRPPRPRMRSDYDYDYDSGYPMSENSKFPYNTNFNTGVPKPSGPDFDFDFPDFEEPSLQMESSSVSSA